MSLIDIHHIYFIGGPEDLRKRAYFMRPPPTIRVFEKTNVRREPRFDMDELGKMVADVIEHHYMVRQIGKDTYVAIHSSLL